MSEDDRACSRGREKMRAEPARTIWSPQFLCFSHPLISFVHFGGLSSSRHRLLRMRRSRRRAETHHKSLLRGFVVWDVKLQQFSKTILHEEQKNSGLSEFWYTIYFSGAWIARRRRRGRGLSYIITSPFVSPWLNSFFIITETSASYCHFARLGLFHTLYVYRMAVHRLVPVRKNGFERFIRLDPFCTCTLWFIHGCVLIRSVAVSWYPRVLNLALFPYTFHRTFNYYANFAVASYFRLLSAGWSFAYAFIGLWRHALGTQRLLLPSPWSRFSVCTRKRVLLPRLIVIGGQGWSLIPFFVCTLRKGQIHGWGRGRHGVHQI